MQLKIFLRLQEKIYIFEVKKMKDLWGSSLEIVERGQDFLELSSLQQQLSFG